MKLFKLIKSREAVTLHLKIVVTMVWLKLGKVNSPLHKRSMKGEQQFLLDVNPLTDYQKQFQLSLIHCCL